MPSTPSNRLAIDIGGTFTDVVLDWQGSLHSTKLLTTHEAPAEAVLAGVLEIIAKAEARLSDIDLILHGTTLATNALIERRGAKTALLTTAGHRDVLEMAHENRFEQYDLNIVRPAPLVPRHLRLPIRERLDAQGEVLLALDQSSVDAALLELRRANVESVAIGLLHAYANPVHEELLAERLAHDLPGVSVTLASEVCPEIREYERLSTAVANAYVRPLMAGYIAELERRLAAAGSTAALLLMTSGGGLTTAAAASRFPIRLVESGPAGGAILAASHAQRQGADRVLAFDMGGTTAKLTLIDDAEPLLSRAFEVDRQYRFKKGSGLPIRIPVIEMVEIGAGGGSIASRDTLERISVGPRSAGSQPGPACYNRGGREPAVTDADVLLGKLRPQSFAGGRVPLNVARAQQAIKTLQLTNGSASPTELAHAVSEVVDENMAAAAKAHANEWGKDIAGRVLIAFGGAAPLHAARLARKLGLNRVIIPAGAGVGSALGFLAAPVSFEVVRSKYIKLDDFTPALLADLTQSMKDEALAVIAPALVAEGSQSNQRLQTRRRAFMRYMGQGYEIAVDLPESQNFDVQSLRARFEAAYTELYTRSIPNLAIEVLSWTLSLADHSQAQLAPGGPAAMGERSDQATVDLHWQLFDPESATTQSATCIARSQLKIDDWLDGPALVTEAQTTTFVPTGARVQQNALGDLIIQYRDYTQ